MQHVLTRMLFSCCIVLPTDLGLWRVWMGQGWPRAWSYLPAGARTAMLRICTPASVRRWFSSARQVSVLSLGCWETMDCRASLSCARLCPEPTVTPESESVGELTGHPQMRLQGRLCAPVPSSRERRLALCGEAPGHW